MNKDQVWNKTFGNRTEAYDYAGRKVKKSAYNSRDSQYGWNVDHIRPLSDGGKDVLCNAVACNIETNEEKSDTYPIWNANNQSWRAERIKNHRDCYKIVSNS